MPFKVLKYFSSDKIFLFASLRQRDLIQEKLMFFFLEIVTHTTAGLVEKWLLSPEKNWFVAGICLIWKLMEYTNNNSPDACIIPTFLNKFYNWNYSKFSPEKLHLS